MNFEDLLKKKGYISHTKKYDKKTKQFILEENWNSSYSTYENICFFWIKDGVEICYGLHEWKKPPTLICPRPRVRMKREIDGKIYLMDESMDDTMNTVLQKIDHELIYKAMFDREIVIELEG